MSIICIICKEKLVTTSHHNVTGDFPETSGRIRHFNSLDNEDDDSLVVSTACGHLFHFECLQSWFLTQKRKFQIRGNSEVNSNVCPSCQSPVKEDEDYRRIFPLEDHGEALEKAKLLEKLENLEIYCHQLEIQIQQLAKENDVLLNKVLTPLSSPRGFINPRYNPQGETNGFDTIVKNDRVMWLRPGESPASGIVLSIFKKEGQLCAKIKLDKKIRSTQRTSRILSSFRLDKKQELTVPFDEIVLERDVNANLASNSRLSSHHSSVPINMNVNNNPNNNSNGYDKNAGGGLGLLGGGNKSYSTANVSQNHQQMSNYLDFGRGGGGRMSGQSVTTASTSSGITGSFSSTVSLPDESRRLEGIKESIEDLLQSASAATAAQQQIKQQQQYQSQLQQRVIPHLNRSISYSPGFPVPSCNRVVPGSISSVTPEPPSRDTSTPASRTNSETSIDIDGPRDYVFITPPTRIGSQRGRGSSTSPNKLSSQGRLSPPDGKNKHVTFADEPKLPTAVVEANNSQVERSSSVGKKESHGKATSSSVVVGFTPTAVTRPKPKKKAPAAPSVSLIPPQPMPRPRASFAGSEGSGSCSSTSTIESEHVSSPNSDDKTSISFPVESVKSDKKSETTALPVLEISHYETLTKTNVPIRRNDVNNESSDSFGTANLTELLQDFQEESHVRPVETICSCIDVTLLALLYRSIGFDNLMLKGNCEDTEVSGKIKWIVKENFMKPMRQYTCTAKRATKSIYETLSHLYSEELDVEELMTILFEYLFKLTPFINYSLSMCDYLHQFFIDFTDEKKIRTIQTLLEKSLSIQDDLKLEGNPSPALILQMRHSSTDGVIHYDAVVPNLTLNMEGLIKTNETPRKCYCGRDATLQCKSCMEIDGDKSILGCDRCKEVLEGVHKINGGHVLELCSIDLNKAGGLEISSTAWALSSIICFKDNHYTVFLKDGPETYSPWVYVHSINEAGKLQMKNLPGFGYWLENLVDRYESLNLQSIPPLLLKVLKYSRVYIYVPVTSSTI